ACLLALSVLPAAENDDRKDDAATLDAELGGGLSLPPDRQAARAIEAAEDLIRTREFARAVRVLQGLLAHPEDSFVQVRRGGGGLVHWTSVRAEANRLLGSLPAAGREAYELQFGARAREKLQAARKAGDSAGFAEIAERYTHTRAGAEALALL